MILLRARGMQRALPSLSVFVAGAGVEKHDGLVRFDPAGCCELSGAMYRSGAFRCGKNTFETSQFPAGFEQLLVGDGKRGPLCLAKHAQDQKIAQGSGNAQPGGNGRGVPEKRGGTLMRVPSLDDGGASLRLN